MSKLTEYIKEPTVNEYLLTIDRLLNEDELGKVTRTLKKYDIHNEITLKEHKVRKNNPKAKALGTNELYEMKVETPSESSMDKIVESLSTGCNINGGNFILESDDNVVGGTFQTYKQVTARHRPSATVKFNESTVQEKKPVLEIDGDDVDDAVLEIAENYANNIETEEVPNPLDSVEVEQGSPVATQVNDPTIAGALNALAEEAKRQNDLLEQLVNNMNTMNPVINLPPPVINVTMPEVKRTITKEIERNPDGTLSQVRETVIETPTSGPEIKSAGPVVPNEEVVTVSESKSKKGKK